MLKGDQPALGQGILERQRGVEVGERAIDKPDAAEGVGSREIGRGEGGHVQPETTRGGEIEESCEELVRMGRVGREREGREDGRKTSSGIRQRAIGIVTIPPGRFVKRILNIVHETQHLLFENPLTTDRFFQRFSRRIMAPGFS